MSQVFLPASRRRKVLARGFLLRSKRLESLGRLAGGIVHDFNAYPRHSPSLKLISGDFDSRRCASQPTSYSGRRCSLS